MISFFNKVKPILQKNIFKSNTLKTQTLLYSKQTSRIINTQINYLNQQYSNLKVQLDTYNLYYDDPIVKKEIEYIKDKISQIKYDYKFEKKNASLLLYNIDICKERCYLLNKKIFYYL